MSNEEITVLTEYSTSSSWYVSFSDGNTNYYGYKCSSYAVRAVTTF